MNVISLDIGTTAAKAAPFSNGQRLGEILRQPIPLQLSGNAAELDAEAVIELVLGLIRQAAERLAGRVDRIAVATMHPAICLLDAAGEPVSPILCHLDRRSEPQALEIARHFGEDELLAITGNLPIPGGIACTLLRWIQAQRPEVYQQAARVVPLTTLITSRLTGRYVCDPGTAAFLGTYDVRASQASTRLQPWPAMLEYLALPAAALPDVTDGGQVAGRVRPEPAAKLGLATEPEVLVGLMDTSAACLHAGLIVGNMYNVIGTTDVLVLCTDKPRPQRGVLTRPVGTGPLWFAINTMAAVGAALDWAHRTLFADHTQEQFFAMVRRMGRSVGKAATRVAFAPDLAGSRMTVRQRYGAINGLRLSTTREEILSSLMESLARRSRQRLRILSRQGKPNGQVYLAGGASVSGVFRLWPEQYHTSLLPEDASLRGLLALAIGSGERT